MKKEIVFESAIWEEFQKQAKERRRNPVALVTELMREQLEIWEDESSSARCGAMRGRAAIRKMMR